MVVIDFDSNFVQIEGVFNYDCLDIKIGVDSSASAEINPILSDPRPALLSLDVDAICVAGNDVVVYDRDYILRTCLDHDSTGFEMLELALLNMNVGIDTDKASSARIIRSVALELASDHFDARSLESRDAGYLTIRLSEYSTMDNKRAQSTQISK